MPELPPSILIWRRSSKSPTVPPRQMRNVFPLVGCSAVVLPVIEPPSSTLQNSGFPSQPCSVLPLKSQTKPSDASSARAESAERREAATSAKREANETG